MGERELGEEEEGVGELGLRGPGQRISIRCIRRE